jgi:hypothetical protein
LRAAGLRALHVALNSPVVAHASLPSGPAAAAVAQDAQGAQLCLRSVRSGHSAFFVSSETLAPDPRVALEAALAFAERLGFVFDDDCVVSRGATEALRLWHGLCGDVAPAAEPEPEPELDRGDDLDGEEPELWQDDELVLAAATAPASPALLLSKFRFFEASRQEESR